MSLAEELARAEHDLAVAERKADREREDAFRRGYDDGRTDALAGISAEDGAA